MTEKFGALIREIIGEHFGGLIGDQLLTKAMIKYRIDSFDGLSDETKKLFVRNFIEDCYDHMVDEARKKELEDEYIGRIFLGKLPKREEKKAEDEGAKKLDIFFRKQEEDKFQVVDNLSADDMNKIKITRKDDTDKANLMAVLKKAETKEEDFELEKAGENIDRGGAVEYNEKIKEQTSWSFWSIIPAIMIFASLSIIALRDFNASESRGLFYAAIALFVIGTAWFLKDTVKRRY